MSFKVAIVAEDPTNNGYILTPLVERVLSECGKPHARVNVISNPRTGGYEHAKKLIRTEFIRDFKHVDLLLFLPDADGKVRAAEFGALEEEAEEQGTSLICCAAEQEVETWLLAGHLNRLSTPWEQIRADVSVKENSFQVFIEKYGDMRLPGGGRKGLMLETLRGYKGLKARCPELVDLEERIRALISSLCK